MKIFTISILIGLLLLSGCGQEDTEKSGDPKTTQEQEDNYQTGDTLVPPVESIEHEKNDSNKEKSNRNNDQLDEASNSFDKERAKVVLTEYEKAFQKVVNSTNDKLKQREYTTKQELREHFQHLMSGDLATSMVDTYFREKDDGLYVVATEPPTFLKEDQPFTLTKSSDESATVTQERNNEFIGHVKVDFTLTKKEDFWIIKDIKHNYVD
ncbi:hypothetical protein [Alkalihalobacillus deserti]|uniref:hypothetical protein n=1 Tax=Alkalihalobacillus deserti TaxID=2879466 RepID=UPI001D14D1D7|nr:hypothetical protein [Alkalihalobacillus deserti]